MELKKAKTDEFVGSLQVKTKESFYEQKEFQIDGADYPIFVTFAQEESKLTVKSAAL